MTKRRNSKSLNNNAVILLEERWQVAYWTTALSCTETALHEAMVAVGPVFAAVREYLARRKADSSVADPPDSGLLVRVSVAACRSDFAS